VVHQADAHRAVGDAEFQIRGSSLEDLSAVFERTAESDLPLHGVVHLWGLDAAPADATRDGQLEADALRNATSLLHTVQVISDAPGSERARLWVVSRGAQPAGGQTRIAVSQAPLWGLGRTVAAEQPALWGALVDLDPEESAGTAAHRLVEVLFAGDGEDQIAFRGGTRFVVGRTSTSPPRHFGRTGATS
jgi:myxalamid-type polyketide synthase MxaE and MxaD